MTRTITSLEVLAAGALLAFTGSVPAQGDAAAKTFVTDSIRGNIGEVKMGQLAQLRGHGNAVHKYGETLVSDHTIGLQKAKALAKTLGVAPPTRTSREAIKEYDAMSQLSGEAFDRAFISHMMMGHQKEIARYTEASHDGENLEVADLAKDMLPTLQQHLATAQSIAKDLKAY
jgi:putative membrane protein